MGRCIRKDFLTKRLSSSTAATFLFAVFLFTWVAGYPALAAEPADPDPDQLHIPDPHRPPAGQLGRDHDDWGQF